LLNEASTCYLDETLKEIMDGVVSPSLHKKLQIIGPIVGHMLEEQRIATAELLDVSQKYIYGRNIMTTKLRKSSLQVEVYRLGDWNFPIVFHEGVIINLMNYNRFKDAQRSLFKEQGTPHHTACLSRKFNKNVPLRQPSLFSQFDDNIEEKIQEKTNSILQQLSVAGKTAIGFASIVYKICNGELIGARLMALDANMDCCGIGIDLVPYFGVEISVVVDTAEQVASDTNINPNNGVELSAKAFERLATKRREQLNRDTDKMEDEKNNEKD